VTKRISRPVADTGIAIHAAVPRARFRREFLTAAVCDAARRERKKIAQISFVVVGDREMARLHRKFSGIGGTTDVLTFDLSEPGTRGLDGEIYICYDQARRQAADYRVPLYQEIARLAVHGVLHLAGYDDGTDQQREHMRRLEDRTLNAMGERV
jgi:rRNA maturation RNase YbeY